MLTATSDLAATSSAYRHGNSSVRERASSQPKSQPENGAATASATSSSNVATLRSWRLPSGNLDEQGKAGDTDSDFAQPQRRVSGDWVRRAAADFAAVQPPRGGLEHESRSEQ